MMGIIHFWIIVMLMLVSRSDADGKKNHNEDEREALCSVLSSSVSILKSGRGGSKLQEALRRAIFGSESGGGSIESLMVKIPDGLTSPGSRKHWCGTCLHSDKYNHPGKSIPQDLLCLCTVGGNGQPFNRGSIDKLCGQTAKDLGCESESGNGCLNANGLGWSSSFHGESAKGYVAATWITIVKPCFEKGLKLDLEKARLNLMNGLKIEEGRSASWERSHHECGAEYEESICVRYSSWCGKEHGYPQWLEGLYESLEKANFTQTELTSKGYLNASTEEVVTNGQNVPNEGYSQGVQQDKPGVEQRSKENNNHISHHSEQESGTILTHPHWLRVPVFFI